MPKFIVHVIEINDRIYEIEANTEEEAGNIVMGENPPEPIKIKGLEYYIDEIEAIS